MVAAFSIGDRKIGEGEPCFVIAEAGVNHNGNADMAHALVDLAADAGADAVKFQTFRAERLAAAEAPKAAYQTAGADAAESQRDMLSRLELGEGVLPALMAHSAARGIRFLASPFDEDSVDLLDRLDIAAFKVPSGEITNLAFLRRVAGKGRAVILSTGMSVMDEVSAAVEAIAAAGDPPLALLHCVSAYPADPADCNLRAMKTMADAFAVPVGWSDHTIGPEVALAAVALGARIVEKHFTLDRALPGPDHRASLGPSGIKTLVAAIRRVESSLGNGAKKPVAAEAETAAVARKSLVAVRDLAAGETLNADAVTARRPGTGISAERLELFVGRRLKRSVPAGAILEPDMFEMGGKAP